MNNILELQPDREIKDSLLKNRKIIFLAGSIENNTAKLWQKELIKTLDRALINESILILNPRRDVWTASLKQDLSNIELEKQINWELEGLELAEIIYMHLERDTKSPISLLELGLFAKSNKMIVNCPDGFYRKANIDVVCQKYNIINIENYDESVKILVQKIINI